MLQQNPFVSIIIPAYNRAQLLKECLKSVLAQTYTNWECLVIDDGSTEDTEAVVRALAVNDQRFSFFRRTNQYKSGGCGARNYGLALSKGEYINWFDSDDVMLPEFLQQKIEVLSSGINMVITSNNLVDENLNLIESYDLKINETIFKDYLFWRKNFCIVTHNVLFKREFLIKNNYWFNESILRGQETEMFRRIFLNTQVEEYKLNNRIGFLYRQHPETKTHGNKSFNCEFKKNSLTLIIDGLNYTQKLNDAEIKNYYLRQIRGLLQESKVNSKKFYFEILKKISEVADKNIKFRVIILLLKINAYQKFHNRLENRIYHEFARCFKYKS